ncbi:hypothetical protein JXB12_03185 [candidate division KSB1 bacterium]|nr:hypothetical protein [candidate division KSB1 bacterium]
MTVIRPSVIGLVKSFGFGDRLGLATYGHIDAVHKSGFTPIFAQQSIREMKRTNRTPHDVLESAGRAVNDLSWNSTWGADADHLQTEEDLKQMVDEGFTMFTIDPSAHVFNEADHMSLEKLKLHLSSDDDSEIKPQQVLDLYLNKEYEIDNGITLKFDTEEVLLRALAKYGRAIAFTAKMYQTLVKHSGNRPFEVEMSVDETATPTTPLEHLFIGLELRRLKVKVVSLAPRFIGEFEKGVDYKGDIDRFTDHYRKHVAIARYCGPYKLSIHSGSDKFMIYPIMGKLSGELLHVKTAGTSYLEALRAVCRVDRALFSEIITFCREHYHTDRASYHVSAELKHIPDRLDMSELETWYLNHPSGRQILHVTYGSVLIQGRLPDGMSFKEAIMTLLSQNKTLYRDLLAKHLGKHIKLLSSQLD